MEYGDVPPAVLLCHRRGHQPFARRQFRAVRSFRARDHRIGIDRIEPWGEKTNALHHVRAPRVFEIARKDPCEMRFDLFTAMVVRTTHIREIGIIDKRHRSCVRVMAAERFIPFGEDLLDGLCVGLCA